MKNICASILILITTTTFAAPNPQYDPGKPTVKRHPIDHIIRDCVHTEMGEVVRKGKSNPERIINQTVMLCAKPHFKTMLAPPLKMMKQEIASYLNHIGDVELEELKHTTKTPAATPDLQYDQEAENKLQMRYKIDYNLRACVSGRIRSGLRHGERDPGQLVLPAIVGCSRPFLKTLLGYIGMTKDEVNKYVVDLGYEELHRIPGVTFD